MGGSLILVQQKRHQQRRVFDSPDGMWLACAKVEQLPSGEFLSFAVSGKGDSPFQALHGNLANRFVSWNLFACRENQSDQLQLGGFYQGCRLGITQCDAQRQLDDLASFGMLNRLRLFS